MMHLNRFQNWLLWIGRVQKFNINMALRQQWRNGREAGLEEGRKEKADCKPCPLYQADQRRLTGYQQSEWNSEPERHTEPNMERFQRHPGRYAVYHKDMERKKAITRKLGEPTQHDLPKLQRLQVHKITLH